MNLILRVVSLVKIQVFESVHDESPLNFQTTVEPQGKRNVIIENTITNYNQL